MRDTKPLIRPGYLLTRKKHNLETFIDFKTALEKANWRKKLI